MPEDFDVFIWLNLSMRNLRRSSKVHGYNWKSQRRLLCLVKGWMAESTGRPVARMMITSQNWRVSWKQRNPRECVWKELYQEFMKKIVSFFATLQFGTQTHSDASSDENSWSKSSSGQRMWKTWENFGMGPDESQKQDRADRWSKDEGAKVHFASLMDICHLKNAELETNHQTYKGRVVLRGDIVKDDSGSYAVFTEQGSSASQLTAAKIMDIISRLPGCDGQAADAVSAYTQVKMEDAHKILKIPKSECPDIWICLPWHKWPKSWSSMEDPVVPLERNLYGHPLAGLLWERQFDKNPFKARLEKGFLIGNDYSYSVKKNYSYLCM